nr:PREDICTED: WD repeat-containing protein 72 [Latimeria chalumnae]|eukprot:XP_005996242.1 PREDICTED: WD repeat-containing protein 72 [Latimeria chalumnae]
MKGSMQLLTVWGRRSPSHTITAIMVTDDQQTIVTGSQEGQLCLWNFSSELKMSPRAFLFGHTSPITCLGKSKDFEKQPYVVSAAEDGEMCLWNVASGQCIQNTQLPYTHTVICYYYCSFRMSGGGWLLCCGQYQDVLIIDAWTLEILHTFNSSQSLDWISCMCIIHSLRIQEDTLLAVSVSGDLKVWDLSSAVKSVQERNNIYEKESKCLQCMNCQTIRFCTYTERLLLIICSDSWKVYDYCDFSLLCISFSKSGQRFAGGEILAANRLLVWTEDGQSYIYQLPDRGVFKSISALNGTPNDTVFPRLLCYMSLTTKSFQQVMGFLNERREPFYKILFCGETHGSITLWHIPDVPVTHSDGSPRYIPVTATSALQDAFKKHRSMTDGIIDQLGGTQDRIINSGVTASVYIPHHDMVVCGYQDGKIIVAPALQAAKARLLEEHSVLSKEWLLYKSLQGHSGRVTCLLHLHSKSTNFDVSWLASGGQDSCVILWDVFTGEMIFRFALHAGLVVHMSVPPQNCRPKFHQTVCCLTSDHSIVLLNFQDKMCLMHGRPHLFPVKTIKWHPIEDFLLVGCADGSVCIWDIENGALDRHETGETAKTILSSCDDSHTVLVETVDSILAGTRSPPPQEKKQGSHKATGSFKLSIPSSLPVNTGQSLYKYVFAEHSWGPFTVLPLKIKDDDDSFHILLFDMEELLKQLLPEPKKELKPANSFHGFDALRRATRTEEKPAQTLKRNKTATSFSPLNDQVKYFVHEHLFHSDNLNASAGAGVGTTRQKNKYKNPQKLKARTLRKTDVNITTDTVKLLLSCLFPWSVNKELDEFCIENLGIFMPQCAVSFGLLSKQYYHVSLTLPGWYLVSREKAKENQMCNLISPKIVYLAEEYTSRMGSEAASLDVPKDMNIITGRETMSHLLSLVFMVSQLMNLPLMHDGNPRLYSHQKMESQQCKRRSTETIYPTVHSLNGEVNNVVHNLNMEMTPLVKLASHWRDQSVEVLEAVQAMLLAEIQSIMKTLRKTSISSQTVSMVQNENAEIQELPWIEQAQQCELKHIRNIIMTTPVSLVKHDNSPDLAKPQEAEDMPDGCVFEQSDSPECVRFHANICRIFGLKDMQLCGGTPVQREQCDLLGHTHISVLEGSIRS